MDFLQLVTAALSLLSTIVMDGAAFPIDLNTLGPVNSTLTFYPNRHSDSTAYLAIDGISPNGTGKPLKSECPGTGDSPERWVRIDLQGLYLVQGVRLSVRGYSGHGVTVHVGNSDLINSSLGSYQCGDVWKYLRLHSPYFYGAFMTFECEIPQRTRYIVIRGNPDSSCSVEVCEVQVFYATETDAVITRNGNGGSSVGFASVGLSSASIVVLAVLIVIVILRRYWWRR